jgi:GNAT superfamily N-acetyltransferase
VATLDLVRVTDETGLRAYHGVLVAVFASDFLALPADPIEDIRPGLSGSLNGERIEFWWGTADGEPVVAVTIRYSERDNLDLANLTVDVHPDWRRRGFARDAAAGALKRIRELGRTRMLGEVPTFTRHLNPAPAEYLAQALGARPLHAERRRLLDLSELDPARLTSVIEDSRRHGANYSTVSWRDRTPVELVDEMAALTALMSTDPPQGELDLEAETWDADRYLERERSVIRQGREHLVVAARDDRTGHLAGFTDLAASRGAEVGYQWATIVHRDHRGHRLGMLMKALNLQWLLTELPHVRCLNTWNAEENTYMVSVNEALGYRPVEAWREWGLSL